MFDSAARYSPRAIRLALDAKQYWADAADAVTELILNLAAAAFKRVGETRPVFSFPIRPGQTLYH